MPSMNHHRTCNASHHDSYRFSGRDPAQLGLLDRDLFFAAYPIVTSVMWITTSLFFRNRWEKHEAPVSLTHYPSVSILIPAHNEERGIAHALAAATAIDYPYFEIVVVDDGSTDNTRSVVEQYVRTGQVRLIAKQQNEGKAMAMNDALPCLNGEIVLIMEPMPSRSLTYSSTCCRTSIMRGSRRSPAIRA